MPHSVRWVGVSPFDPDPEALDRSTASSPLDRIAGRKPA